MAGYADAMDMVFESFESITITENHIKQLHGVLLKYSSKDQEHRGHYKKVPNHVEAFGPDGKSLGVVFETATPFETPRPLRRAANLTSIRRDTCAGLRSVMKAMAFDESTEFTSGAIHRSITFITCSQSSLRLAGAGRNRRRLDRI